jgi:type IV pilus assembly protein PilY1
MKSILIKGWLMLLASCVSLSVQSADIDLFASVALTGADAPQVLLVMDNGASFSSVNSTFRCSITTAGVVKTDGTGGAPTQLDGKNAAVEQCALYSVIQSLDTTTTAIKVGIMVFNSTGQKSYDPETNTFSAPCSGGNGGCLIMPIVPVNATTKPRILEYIRQWTVSGNNNYNIKGPAALANGATMQEAWAYYYGKTGISGRDYSGIAPAGSCAYKNVIYVGNNYNTQATPKDFTNAAGSPLKALNGTFSVSAARANPAATTLQLTAIADTIKTSCSASTTSLSTDEGDGAYALNWALYNRDQGITTFSIGIAGPSCDAAYAAHMTKLGSSEVGGGKYFETTDFNTLVAAFKTVTGEILSVNSVFAAVSLPVSVNAQGSYLNQVFVGMFRPADKFLPRWSGNLKQYKLGLVNNVLKLQDADGVGAINTVTGFITACARSYWTPKTVDDYWKLDPSGLCTTVADAKYSNYPDGDVVEKGAQAFKLRSIKPSDRKVKTCSPVFADCTTMTDFATANTAITQALLNPKTGATDRDDMINWSRGQNVGSPSSAVGSDELNKGTDVMRPSSHGDVVHSRPVPVNHGTEAAPSVVVYYGGNDGYLRAVNGNRGSITNAAVGSFTSSGTTFAAGEELWSFMPPEFYGKIKRLRDNDRAISYPTSTVSTSVSDAKDYGFDGPVTAFQGTISGSAKSYIYATMRRGARVIYAFDVTTPGSPALLWKKGCPNNFPSTGTVDDAGCSADYTNIGQTWASLKTLYASGYGSGTSPILITGGGYDTCEDYDAKTIGGKNHNCTQAATKGNRVYLLDASTGNVLRAFPTDRAVIADSTIVRDSSGKAKYAYTADMGGNVYRITFGNGAAASWTITKIASLGCDTPSTCTDSVANRKFMFAPSVVTTDDATYYVMLGSGDREKPIKEYTSSKSVTNYYFMLKDTPSDTSWLSSENATCGANVICKDSLLGITTSATPSDASLATKKGWYLGLASTEQVVTSSVTIFGVLTFSTHQPAVVASNACVSNLGTTLVYSVNYLNAASENKTTRRYEDVSGDGLPPSPVAGRVKLDSGVDGVAGVEVPFCIGCSKDSSLEASLPRGPGVMTRPKQRLYWYLQK